jgi:regulator of replication initiation timing
MGQKKGQLEELICTIADLKTENQHLKRLLSETKLAIKDAMKSNNYATQLRRVVDVLSKNGVRDLFTLNFDL